MDWHPDAGPALIEAMGEFGALFGPGSLDPAMAAFLTSMPVAKVPLMGMSEQFTQDDLDGLPAAHGSR